MANVSLKNIYKIYPSLDKKYRDGVLAVSNFSMEIEDNEFIVFVGPSGCGKSTTLRMIAGLEDISSGELYIDNQYIILVLTLEYASKKPTALPSG